MQYNWKSLDLIDPTNQEDIWDLITLFNEENEFLSKYQELPAACPFAFLFQEFHQDEEGIVTHRPIGFIFLEAQSERDSILQLHCGIKKSERGKKNMKYALEIFNYKLMGETMERDPILYSYEQMLKDLKVFAQVPHNDCMLNHLFHQSGNPVYLDGQNIVYQLGFKRKKDHDKQFQKVA